MVIVTVTGMLTVAVAVAVAVVAAMTNDKRMMVDDFYGKESGL